MARREINRSRGFVHDINALASLSEDQTNIRLLSDSSLYILQNLSLEDVTFLSRYGQILAGGYYLPVQEGTPEASLVSDAVDLIRRDLNSMTVEDTLQCICEQLQNISSSISAAQGVSCGCDIGSDVETTDGQEGGPLPDPVNGVPYEGASPITDRKCVAANYIHDGISAVVTELRVKRVDSYAFAGLAFVLSLVVTIVGTIVLGPFGVLLGAVAGSFLAMATLLLKASFSLTILETAILADEQGAVCALFAASSASAARTAYTDHLLANGATSLEIEFVEYLLTNNLLNLLFFAWGDSEDVLSTYVATIDCSLCPCETPMIAFTYGSIASGSFNVDGIDFTVQTEPWSSWHRVIFDIQQDPGCPCVDYAIEIKSATPGFAGVPFGLINDCNGVDVWRYNVQGYGAVIDVWDARYVDLGNTSPTEVVVNISQL